MRWGWEPMHEFGWLHKIVILKRWTCFNRFPNKYYVDATAISLRRRGIASWNNIHFMIAMAIARGQKKVPCGTHRTGRSVFHNTFAEAPPPKQGFYIHIHHPMWPHHTHPLGNARPLGSPRLGKTRGPNNPMLHWPIPHNTQTMVILRPHQQ